MKRPAHGKKPGNLVACGGGLYRILVILCVGLLLVGAVGLAQPRLSLAAVPPQQEPQEVDVVELVNVVNRWHLTSFKDYHFKKWISLGNVFLFNERIADGDGNRNSLA